MNMSSSSLNWMPVNGDYNLYVGPRNDPIPAVASDERATFRSLGHLLQIAAQSKKGITFASRDDSRRLTYQSLMEIALRNGNLLVHQLQQRQSKIALIHFDNHADNIEAFWSAIMAGYIPAMSTPLSADHEQRSAHLNHLSNLLEHPLCITSEVALGKTPELGVLECCSIEDIRRHRTDTVISDENFVRELPAKDGPAALMLTSGSTGNAKAVVLTLEQIMSSISSKSVNWKSSRSSVFMNWTGFDHVANLVEMHLQAMCLGAEQIQVDASQLLRDPSLFLRLIDRYCVNYTFAPNFFLSLLNKEMASVEHDRAAKNPDLSRLVGIMSGGEANVVQMIDALTKRLQSLGAHGQVIRPGYGLTETCAGLAYSTLDLDAEAQEHRDFASVGKPIPKAKLRISLDGKVVKPYQVGELEIFGPMVFSGYYNNSKASYDAFTADSWFRTGDRAYVDDRGNFNVTGRIKELLNVNGVKFSPQDIEQVLEKADVPNVLASYFAVIPCRAADDSTEGYSIVFGITVSERLAQKQSAEHIARVAAARASARPAWVVPLSLDRLDKSSLGKLSRSKIQSLFSKGAYDDVKLDTFYPLTLDDSTTRIAPRTSTEIAVVMALSKMLDIPVDVISVGQTIFELGITSISLFRLEKVLRQQLLFCGRFSVVTFLDDPTISVIARTIASENDQVYNPVSQIQRQGSKTPLWLAHPASGNILSFLPLAKKLTDRPLYALSMRGVRPHETPFDTMSEMCDCYTEHIKRVQPNGPYALMGYSLGSTVAFEVGKRLEANGDEVALCAALDSPPHVIPLIGHLGWTDAAVQVTYFLELIPQSRVHAMVESTRNLSKVETIQYLLEVSDPSQRAALNLDPDQLLALADATESFGTMGKKYHPEGLVRKMDIFYATPLQTLEGGLSRAQWIDRHISKWQDHSQEQIELHECVGDHADMINPTHVGEFMKRLAPVLQSRNI